MYFSKLNALLWIAELQSFLRLLKNILQAPQEEEPLFSLPADLTIFPSHHIFYPPVLRSTTLMDIKWKKKRLQPIWQSNKVNSKKLLKCQIILEQQCAWYRFLTFSRFLPFINSRIHILWQCSDLFSVSGYNCIFIRYICNQCWFLFQSKTHRRRSVFYCTRSSKILFENQNSIEKNCWNICERIRRICRPSIISRRVGDISIFHPKERRSQDEAWTSYWRMIMIYTTL